MDVPPPPEFAQDDVPFEGPPQRRHRARRGRARRRRDKPLSAVAISLAVLVYALGAGAVGYAGTGLLLSAWLMVGPLGITVYLTFDGHGSLLNPYTLFFALLIAASVGAQVLGW